MILGYALGFIYGQETVLLLGTWRAAFLIESCLMVPFIIISFCIRTPHSSDSLQDGFDDGFPRLSLKKQLISLFKNTVFLCIIAGYASFAFTIGGIAFWGSSLIHSIYSISPTTAAISLGIMTVSCGLISTLIGSVYMDYLLRKYQYQADVGDITENQLGSVRTEIACRLAFWTIGLGAGVGICAALVDDYVYFLAGFSTAEFLLFL